MLTRIYGPVVFGWARSRGFSEECSADIVQEVFLTVFRSLDVERGGRFRNWLWRVFRSRMIDRHRRKSEQIVATGGTPANAMVQSFPDTLPNDAPEENSDERQETLVRAILALKDRFEPNVWNSFWRVAIEGHTPKEVASDLGVSVWAVYKARNRCQKQLQEILADLDINFTRLR